MRFFQGGIMYPRVLAGAVPFVLIAVLSAAPEKKPGGRLNVNPPPIATDKSVKYDYDIVYVRAPRHGDKLATKWAEVGDPRTMEAGADLMLLHPDGSEEVLVRVEPQQSIADPFVSFDGKTVY